MAQAYSAIAFQEHHSHLCLLIGSPDGTALKELRTCLEPGNKNYLNLLDVSVLSEMRSNTSDAMTNLGELYTATTQEFEDWMRDPLKQNWMNALEKVKLSFDHSAAFERLLKILNLRPSSLRRKTRSIEHPLVFGKVCIRCYHQMG